MGVVDLTSLKAWMVVDLPFLAALVEVADHPSQAALVVVAGHKYLAMVEVVGHPFLEASEVVDNSSRARVESDQSKKCLLVNWKI